jgi:hypothetical protein
VGALVNIEENVIIKNTCSNHGSRMKKCGYGSRPLIASGNQGCKNIVQT